jgi:putative hydrolase of the HAD superfamily
MSYKEPKTFFFDIGGVLLTNGWGHESRERAAKHFGIKYEEINFPHEFIFNTYEIGKINLHEYLETAVFTQPRNFTYDDFTQFMLNESQELPGMIPWLIEWKKKTGHTLISINNEGKELNTYRVEKFQLKRVFDAFVSSCDVGMRKPDPGIFRLALGIAQSRAEECIYFDDRPMLVAAAKKIGINAYVHEGFEQTKKILENLG